MGVEVEALENVPHRGRETPEVGEQIFPDVVLVAHELLQVERGGVVKELARFLEEKGLGIQPGSIALLLFSKHFRFGGLEDAVKAAEDSEGQDDLAVIGLLVITTEEVRHGPDEGREIGIGPVRCAGGRRSATLPIPDGETDPDSVR